MDCASSYLRGHLSVIISVISYYIYSSYKNLEQLRKRSFANHFLRYKQWHFGIWSLSVVSTGSKSTMPDLRSGALLPFIWGLSRALDIIRSSRNLKADKDYEVSLARLEEIIVGQISTADNALEDWKDIVPEEVKQLTQAFESDNQYNGEKQWLNQSAEK